MYDKYCAKIKSNEYIYRIEANINSGSVDLNINTGELLKTNINDKYSTRRVDDEIEKKEFYHKIATEHLNSLATPFKFL